MSPQTVSEVVRAVTSGRCSASELIAGRRELAESLDGSRIFTATDWEAAERSAAALDERRRRGGPLGQLAGVPFTVKDIIAVAEHPLTAGSRAFASNVSRYTAPVVDRLRSADAILIGKANCPEFGLSWMCDNELVGRTINPRFPAYSTGGSSGGDAAGVAAGVSSLGIGTDYGGSVRWPAQSTGVAAIRPTPHRVDPSGQVPGTGGAMGTDGKDVVASTLTLQGQLQVIGPMADDISGLVAALRVMDRYPAAAAPVRRALRIGWSDGTHIGPVRRELTDAVATAMVQLGRRGCEMKPAAALFEGCLDAYSLLRSLEPMYDHRQAVEGREHLLADSTRMAFAGRGSGPGELTDARQAAMVVRHRALRVFDEFDAVILPVAGGSACRPDGVLDVDGEEIAGWRVMAHCRSVTMTGCPAVSVPISTAADGLAISVQVVAPPWQDYLALHISGILEQIRQGPPIP